MNRITRTMMKKRMDWTLVNHPGSFGLVKVSGGTPKSLKKIDFYICTYSDKIH
jgi:hypothetical protein